ncbi:Ig-like domain-containing protein [Comamonas fluminis]|uniref:Ig-like domain-containing protein n=1 Tax=Comamonas fluminis TaxID=2796366 RepID=UPI001C47766A|nr:Ig-like domain-containing protein [Comamonas fluminis]
MRFLISAISIAVMVVACGGGGGSGGTPVGGGSTGGSTGGGSTSTADAASVEVSLDKTVITNSGSDAATLTVLALDSNRNPVANVPVSVTLDSGVFKPDAKVTDDSGQVTGKIEIGANKSNRDIKYQLKAGTQSASGSVSVTGSQIVLNMVPSPPVPGQDVEATVKVSDVSGTGIAGTEVNLSGSMLSSAPSSVKTNTAGIATWTFKAPVTAQMYTLQIKASGVAKSEQVMVTGGGSFVVPDAVGVVSAASLAITPNTVKPNKDGGKTNTADLRALFVDKDNRAIPNMRVRFEIVKPGLGDGEAISSGDQTVLTNASGIALAQYIPGKRVSPTNGVTIRMCYGLTDASVANNQCSAPVLSTLTVAEDPVSITIGDNNELEKGANNLTYIKKFDVAVVDAAGVAVSGSETSVSVDLLQYGYGAFNAAKTAHDLGSGYCLNEDTNRNGNLDVGEDLNKDGKLTPPKADIAVSYLSGSKTGANGRLAIQVEYPQNVATWLAYKLTVSSNVSGSEGRAERVFWTEFVEGDEKDGSFLQSPYGALFAGCVK